ncbi:MAG TPA: transposase, partial [Desulfosporosinus sp.]|nr:transposase [Desulfosporosinus sp.]
MIQGINFYHNTGGAVELALVPGRDYPNTYRGFVEMFPDDTACAAFLIRLRWPEGFICPA